MIPFAGVLLAGGRSRRMGRDKALLPLPDGRLLWQRQLAVLQALEPAELFLSGPPRQGFPPDVPLLADHTPGLGPLAGIAAALGAMRSSLLVVLAVDMPAMTTDCLRGLLRSCREGQGTVPRRTATGFYEPLAAVYPQACLPPATAQLAAPDRSLQSFVRAAGPLVKPWDILVSDEALFANWNEPEPLTSTGGRTEPARSSLP